MGTITDDDLRQRVQALVAECSPAEVDMVTFRGEQFDRGLARVEFPEGKGGLGLSPKAQLVVDAELRKAPRWYHDLQVNPIGIGMAMPTVLTHGSEELQDRLLRPCYTGEEVWCQLFSEPSAGSDVAGLGTRAVRDGDEWVVNGQKVWTTLAHTSRWGMLLARSDPEQPKHKGMTYFVIDMHAPGVEVRPLFQITGEAEFNEVFLTDVRIPDSHRLGDQGAGWGVAMTTLMNERVALGGGVPARGSGPISLLLNVWRQRRDQLEPAQRDVERDRVVRLWIRAEAQRLTNWRARDQASTGNPGPEGSVGKLMSAELNKEINAAAVDLLGAAGMLHEPGYPMVRSDSASLMGTVPSAAFLRSRANSIEGGTSEVMRNILGERVLGLPGDVRVDKDVAWADIPRN